MTPGRRPRAARPRWRRSTPGSTATARQRLDRLAPAAITAPTGTTLPIDYAGAAPTVSVRLQEMFGLTRHPTVGADAVPLVIELLSPARRPVQTTADLPGFWARQLRRRAPRPARPLPEAPLARGSGRGRADAAGQAAGDLIAFRIRS